MAASMESARKELAGEYERVQKKAFTNWLNSHLIKVGQKVNDLYEDLRDGSRLQMLIELFTGEKLKREKGKMKVHKLQNIQKVLDYLTNKRKIKLVNIHSESLVEGKPIPTLGLLWTLILHFQISGPPQPDAGSRPMSPVEVSAAAVKKKLLEWAQAATDGYEEVKVVNFDKSWKDGLAFCAIIDRHRPDLLNYDECDPDTPLLNLELAMNVAEKELGIVRIIDPEDIHVERPDDKAVMTYVSFLHNAFPDMPPSRRRRGPEVSMEDYEELFTATKTWMVAKRQEVTKRNFPNTIDEMKAKLDGFHAYKTKELPVHERDMTTLNDMYTKLVEAAAKKKRGAPVAAGMAFDPLADEWVELERENEECEKAMKDHLDKLQTLEDLASSLLSSSISTTLDKLEEEIVEFESTCTSFPPEEAKEKSSTITAKLQALQKPIEELESGVHHLEEGNYHNTETVQKGVEGVKSRQTSLLGRLEGATSVATEVQEVVKVEDNIQELEVWLVTCGKFAANQNILAQIEEHKSFERERLATAKGRMTRITSSPPPPGLENRVSLMNSRWEQILSQTQERLSGLEPLENLVREFDRVKNPLEDWLLLSTETFSSRPLVEVDVERLEEEKREMEGLKEEVEGRRGEVEKLEELAEKFEFETEPLQSLADRYARRLKKQGSIPSDIGVREQEREDSEEPEASFIIQANALQSQWASLQSKVETRSKLVDNLLLKLNDFNGCYGRLKKFMEDGNRLLDDEKPVAENAAQLQQQLETCQEFRSELISKQPEVDSLLSLGREIVAEPQTSAANDDLETRLTGFIQDWSDLQLAWQNWYDQLHARRESAGKKEDEVRKMTDDMRGLQAAMEELFPALVQIETLPTDLHRLQERFIVEVYQPYELLAATSEGLRNAAAMLTDQSAAQEAFQIFDASSSKILDRKQELDSVMKGLNDWWSDYETETNWLVGAESTAADLRPLAGSVIVIATQKEENEKFNDGLKKEHKKKMESVLSSLATLASHDKLLQSEPLQEYTQSLRSRWDTVVSDSEKRVELSTSGHTHLGCYANQSTTFDVWLTTTEKKLVSMSTITGSKEGVAKSCNELEELVKEVKERESELDTMETTGANFLASAKPYQAQLQEFRSKVVAPDDSTLSTVSSSCFVDPEADVVVTTAPEFETSEYENGIATVKGYSAWLRKRYNTLATGSAQMSRRAEEARQRRAEFDGCLETLLPRLQELETLCDEVGQNREKIGDKLENLRVIEVDAIAMETQLQALQSACELLDELCNEGVTEEEGGGGERGEVVKEKEEVEERHRKLLSQLAKMKEQLNDELSDAQAFQDIFSDFDSWLRTTERKIQRDDPLKLEVKELKKGLVYLQAISGDIAAHEPTFEKLCGECRDLIGRGVGDAEELERNLDNLVQRWNAVQIVNDDIEAIEGTIPRLEAFNASYGLISTAVAACSGRLEGFRTSAVTSDGLAARKEALKELHDEAEQERSKFEDLLQSCDLYDTPFDHTHFENDVTSLRDQLTLCDKIEAEKQASLTVLEKKIVPMETMFSQFVEWLSGSETALSCLSPPATEASERAQQLNSSNEITNDVTDHEKTLSELESSVNNVVTLVDESDQSDLSSRLHTVLLRYHCHAFRCHGYPVQRWLDDQSLVICSMSPCAVQVPILQDEIQEVKEYKKTLTNYRPHLLNLDSTSAKCRTPPPTPGGPKPTTKPDETAPKVTKELQTLWDRFDSLETVATERGEILAGFLPSVQLYESSEKAWLQYLERWEERVGKLPSSSTIPSSIDQQIAEIKDLLQSINDHEPDFMSLKKEASSLCQGPPDEHKLLSSHSKLRDSSSAFVAKQLDDVIGDASVAVVTSEGQSSSPGQPSWAGSRPGQEGMESKLADYERRLEELKLKLKVCESEREKQLERAKEAESLFDDLGAWLKEGVVDLDGLRLRDPSCAVIEEQQIRCQALMEDLVSRGDERAKLRPLVEQLTSDLTPDDGQEKAALLQQLSDFDKEWEKLQTELSGCQETLDSAHSRAAPYEDAVEKLFPWIPNALAKLEGLGACPTDPEAVEQRKTEIEALKTEYNALAPVCAGCLDNARSLSSLCEPGDPKTSLDDRTTRLHDDWEKLGALFGDVLGKLTEALVQTQEFKSIADGLGQWMEGMKKTLDQQDMAAARVKHIEGQIEGFKPILADVASYGETVEKTRAIGDKLREEGEEEEKEKIDKRLESLSAQFSELQNAADQRMNELEEALEMARDYENRCDEFDRWLGGAETKLRSWQPLPIASQPLATQEEEIKEFLQEVTTYKPSLTELTQSEESLFSTSLSSIETWEPEVIRLSLAVTRRSSTPRGAASRGSLVPPASSGEEGSSVDPPMREEPSSSSSSSFPRWLERQGAKEAVVIGADLRTRYSVLLNDSETKADQATQQLQSVLSFEGDSAALREWLRGQRSTIDGFAPPGITVETIRAQLTEVEDMERGFTNEKEKLESIDARGTSLVSGCGDELTRESVRSTMAEMNEEWGDCLASLTKREEILKEALDRAQKYQDGYSAFDGWLSGCVETAAEPLKVDGDPSDINRQLRDHKALLEEVKGRKSSLAELVESGRSLEEFVREVGGAVGVADIGYNKMEQRYKTLQESLDGRISKLEQTLDRVGSTADKLRDLITEEEKWREILLAHPPPRVLPRDVDSQISEFSVLEHQYIDLQPAVAEALRQATMFSSSSSSAGTHPEADSDDLPQLHSSLAQANEEVGELVRNWSDRLRTGQTNSNKFDQDYSALLSWIRAKQDELATAEPVAGIPDRISTQLQEINEMAEEVKGRRSDLAAVGSLGESLSQGASSKDSMALAEMMVELKSAYENLEGDVVGRRRNLEDGMKKAQQFVNEWDAAMATVEAKNQELRGMSAVGADIDTVKTQLEEQKEFTESLSELKPQISEVQSAGKFLKEACSTKDGPAITQQLEQLNTAWAKLNTDTLNRKHQLEDALLQLGQFHDALAQLLSWIADSTGKLTEAAPPGVKAEVVEGQLSELKSLDSAIASHESTVSSLNEAAEKLMSSNATDNSAETEQEIASLNEKWQNLKKLAADRRSSLDSALEKAQRFHDNWKKESDWLTEAERRAYADWIPRGLPETCDMEIQEHEVFTADVQAHEEQLEVLKSEGEGLKSQGSPDDGKRVDHWLEDLAQRIDELGGAIDDRQVQLQQAKEKAVEFDESHKSLLDKLKVKEETMNSQEPIHSEVEVVKKQLEENKDFLKGVAELEGELDTLEGLGLLLASGCVREDKDVVLKKTNDLRSLWDSLNSAAIERQASLEESLLSLGEFEDAYSELWAWLTDALRQLGGSEPITGDPDMVAAQLARHKVLQKQLGARMSSRNAVTKAAKTLMKQKTGDDRAVLKKKLQDLEREWEKVCQLSVDRQSRLEEAYRGIAQFRSNLGPVRSWMTKVLPSLDDSEPVHGDLQTVLYLTDTHKGFQKELGSYQRSVDSTNTSGQHLVAELLDDPTVTQQDMAEVNEMWDSVCAKSVQKQERLDKAQEAAREFENGLSDILGWIDGQRDILDEMPPPDEDASVLQEQIEENKAFGQEVTVKQVDYDRVRAEGQHLLQLAHPQAVPILQSSLEELETAWLDLRGRVGSRSEALASLLLELHGLQDMLDDLWTWVAGAEATMTTTEASPVGNDMETVETQLAQHEAFQEEMATHQPNMDALNKIAKKRKAETPTTNPEMTKRITSLYKRWQRLWLRSSERHRQLLEARTRLNDIALARSFNFDTWRKRFNGWVDQQKLRVNDLFRRFDSNHDGMLTREEFMKGLKASGLAMSQIELEKISDHFDRDNDGYIDLSEISSILRGLRRARSLAKKQPISDSEKIDYEIQHQVSRCSCSKKFKVVRVAEGQYRFGDSQKLRLVRILRSTVMVRVGGGWEPLEEFLRKHDPCRATGRTNTSLRNMDVGLATASFATKTQSAISHKNSDLRSEAGGERGQMTYSDPSGRKHTVATKRTVTTVVRPARSPGRSRETTPTRTAGHATGVRTEPLKHTLVRQASPKTKVSGGGGGGGGRSRTPGRSLSPTKEVGGGKTSTPTTPSHIPKPQRRPVSPSSTAHTAIGTGPKPSGIPTPSSSSSPARSRLHKTSPRLK